MSFLNIADIKSRLEQLRANAENLRKEMDELGTLIALASKYSSVKALTPVKIGEVEALTAVGNAIASGAMQTKKDRIVSTCEIILMDGRRRFSRELVLELRMRGIEVGGANATKEAAALASYLARKDQKSVFVSDVKAGGWTLQRLARKARSGAVVPAPDLFHNGLGGHRGHTGSMLMEGAELE